jgi:hypothetical protein
MSSDPSRIEPRGDPIDDRFGWDCELDNRPIGEAEREGDSERGETAAVDDAITVEFRRSELKD